MTCDFDAYAESYEVELTRAISFAGKDPTVFTEAKARSLLAVAEGRLGDLAKATALDVGCGMGNIHRSLAPRFSKLHGIDVSAGLLDAARSKNADVAYELYDGLELPFESNAFDLAFAICVVHHVPPNRWERFIAEMARVVRPGGLAAVIEHNALNPLTRLVTIRCAFDKGIALVPRRRLEQLMHLAGMNGTASRYILFSPWRGAAVDWAERRLERLPLGAQYITYANASDEQPPSRR
jgi:ubiquinone/menaquinone biosynthesis C-methylase UbiE